MFLFGENNNMLEYIQLNLSKVSLFLSSDGVCLHWAYI